MPPTHWFTNSLMAWVDASCCSCAPIGLGCAGKFSGHGGSLAGDVQRHLVGVATSGGAWLRRAGPTAAIPARGGPWPGCQRVPWPQCPGAGPGWLFRSRPGGWAKVNRALGAARNHRADGHGRRASHCPAVLRQAVRACTKPLVHCYRSWPGTVQVLPRSVLARCAPRPVPAVRRRRARWAGASAPCHKKARPRAAMWGLLLPFVGPVRRARPGREPSPAARQVKQKRHTAATSVARRGMAVGIRGA